MPPVGCEGSRLERGFFGIKKEKSPPEETQAGSFGQIR